MRIFKQFSEKNRKEFYSMITNQWNEDFNEIEQKYHPDVFLSIKNNKIIAGIAVFKSIAPETENYLQFAKKLFSQKSFYLGYLIVNKNYRNIGVGSEFMEKFLKKFPKQKFWLAVEDSALQQFYEKLGFSLIAKFNKEKIFQRDVN